MMADLSSSSNLMALEGLPEDLRKGIHEEILPHCYQVTEQGVIMMNEAVIDELRMYDLPRHRKSFADLINNLLAFVDDLLNIKNSVDPIPFNIESVSEEPAIVMSNPCKILPNCDVVGQETSRPSLAKIVDLKSPNKSIETTSSTLTLGGKQNKGISAGCAVTGLTGAQTGLTGAQTDLIGRQPGLIASSRVSQNKSKPKMIKPKKPKSVVWKTIESKGRHKHQREKLKSMGNFRLSLKDKRLSMMLVSLKIPNAQNLLLKRSYITRIGNGVTLTNQCSFLHMDHQCLCHGNLTLICIIFVLHGIIVHICRLLVIFVKPIGSRLLMSHHLCVMTVLIIRIGQHETNKRKVIKQVYRVKKDSRLNKNSDLTLDIEKPTIEKSSASSTDEIVPNNEHVINNVAEQQSCSAGGQQDLKMVVSQSTGLTGVLTGLTGLARKSGRAKSILPNSKVVKKKPNFAELLYKYQRIAEQKQNNRLGEQR
jgi:hypothetical protein